MTEADRVSLRDFLLHVMNERDKRYEQRFNDLERARGDLISRMSSLESSRSSQAGSKEEHTAGTKEAGDMMARMLSFAAVMVAAIAALAVWMHK